MACEKAGQLSKSALESPVVELIDVTWKNASGNASKKLVVCERRLTAIMRVDAIFVEQRMH